MKNEMENETNISWEGWELRHLSQRAHKFGLERIEEELLQLGWKTKGNDLTHKNNRDLHDLLVRLAKIPKLKDTCYKENCAVCKKVTRMFETEQNGNQKWKLRVETYRWQKEAEEYWYENHGRGIVKVVTGAGKTVLALSLISRLKQGRAYRDNGLRIAIVVPTTALLDQWYEEVRYLLNLEEEDIGVYYGEMKEPLSENPLTIYVLPSAAKHLTEHEKALEDNEDLFLIVDECHRSGSPVFSKIYETQPEFTLGLSATPERRSDFGFEDILIPELGPIIYQYDHKQAVKDRIIPPFRLKRISVKLQRDERQRYDEYTEDIRNLHRVLVREYPQLNQVGGDKFFKILGSLTQKYDDPILEKYTTLVNLRKSVIHTSKNKMKALVWIIENELASATKTLIFHERIDNANEIFHYLKNNNFSVARYHSKLPMEVKKKSLRDYREGKAQILVACTALDEGLDVPATSAGIIVAATSSIRQRIQRIGRILRRDPGKDHSLVYSVFVEGLEDDIFTDSVMRKLEEVAERVEFISLS